MTGNAYMSMCCMCKCEIVCMWYVCLWNVAGRWCVCGLWYGCASGTCVHDVWWVCVVHTFMAMCVCIMWYIHTVFVYIMYSVHNARNVWVCAVPVYTECVYVAYGV